MPCGFDAAFWISWAKRASSVPTDLTRDQSWDLLTLAGLVPVAGVSIDGT
jgi:hypothetical protein